MTMRLLQIVTAFFIIDILLPHRRYLWIRTESKMVIWQLL